MTEKIIKLSEPYQAQITQKIATIAKIADSHDETDLIILRNEELDDPYFKPFKDEFKKIRSEVVANDLLFVSYYQEDEDEDTPQAYKNLSDYLSRINDILESELNPFLDAYTQMKDLNYNAEEVIETATTQEYNIFEISEHQETEDQQTEGLRELEISMIELLDHNYYGALYINFENYKSHYLLDLDESFKLIEYLRTHQPSATEFKDFLKSEIDIYV